MQSACTPDPSVSFLSLVFSKRPRKTSKTARICSPPEPLKKKLEVRSKHSKNNQEFRSNKNTKEIKTPRKIRERPPWVDQSCADCPGFPVLSAGDAPPPELRPGASERAPGLAFAFMALRAHSWILSAPQRCNAERSDAQRNFFGARQMGSYANGVGWI